MNKIILSDFNSWEANDKFTNLNYIYHILKNNKISTDLVFSFLEFFWPTFVVHDDLVFLKDNFSKTYLEELRNTNSNIEFWVNLTLIESIFENDEDGEKRAVFISHKLIEMWETKLKKEFPDKDFDVKYIYDSEFGEYGLTFYQKKYELNDAVSSFDI